MIRILLRGIFKISILLLLIITFLVLGNLYSYQQLVDEKPIATLTFSPINAYEYDATLRLGDECEEKIYRLFGDEWRIDAQFLKWKSWATLFGVDAMYRIDRLSGRYSDVNRENTQRHIAHEIKPVTILDLSKIAERYEGKFPPVDTLYGSSAYEKMKAQTLFTVFRTQSGILIREQIIESGIVLDKCINDSSLWKNTIRRMDQSLASMLGS